MSGSSGIWIFAAISKRETFGRTCRRQIFQPDQLMRIIYEDINELRETIKKVLREESNKLSNFLNQTIEQYGIKPCAEINRDGFR